MHAGAAALGLVAALLLGSCPAAAQAPEGLGQLHSFKAWHVACDNTRACEAHGYSPGGEALPAVLVVQRAAGPGAQPHWRLGFGDISPTGGAEAPWPKGPVALSVGSLRLTLPAPDPKSGMLDLGEEHARALRPWLLRAEALQLRASGQAWTVSLAGASAALLKMDDLQGRVGTPGALVRPGPQPEATVPPAVPVPVVRAAVLPPQRAGDKALLGAIHREIPPDADNCPRLSEPGTLARGEIFRLSERQVLVVFECWLAAYNAGSGAWLASDRPPHAPVRARFQQAGAPSKDEEAQPTFPTFEGKAGGGLTVHSAAKGRGVGDCYSVDRWVWDGKRFALLEATVSPCEAFTAGGLPMTLWRAR